MSRDFNKAILLGRLARDPDVRFTPNKQKTARITLCCGKQWKNKVTGEMQSHTDFITVTAWSGTAEILEKYTKKGSQILVEGHIATRDYDDAKTGQHKWVFEVVADSIVLLGGGQQGASTGSGDGYSGAPQSYGGNVKSDAPDAAGGSYFDDDFPLDFSDIESGAGDPEIPF